MKYLIILLLLSGCTTPGLHHVVNIPAIQVVITDGALPCGEWGCAEQTGDGYRITIRGRMTGDGIDFSRYVAGHELVHVLRWLSDDVKDPHQDWEYKILKGWWQ